MTVPVATQQKPVFLIWGAEGWVATHLKVLLETQGMHLSVLRGVLCKLPS